MDQGDDSDISGMGMNGIGKSDFFFYKIIENWKRPKDHLKCHILTIIGTKRHAVAILNFRKNFGILFFEISSSRRNSHIQTKMTSTTYFNHLDPLFILIHYFRNIAE